MEVECGGATDGAFARDLDAIVQHTEDEVITPPIHTWIEDADHCLRFGVTQLEAGELRAVAIATCQSQVEHVRASTAGAGHEVLDLKRAVEELLGSEAILALVVRAFGDLAVLSRRHARRTEPRGPR
jgi:hypothetical protein